MENWDKLTAINKYLEDNRENGIQAFEKLLKRAKKESVELVVLNFTYENIEAHAKVNGKFELFDELFEVLSQYDLDQLRRYKYNEENQYQDFVYWKFSNLIWELIEVWIFNCYEFAIGNQETSNIKFYFKRNHDSSEILELNTCMTKFERSEYEIDLKNNEKNVMDLLN